MARPVAVVTGGAGFIGSHMVDLLVERDFEVRIVDNFRGGHERNLAHHTTNPNVTVDRTDITKLEPTASVFRDAQHVFHFAGIADIVPSIDNPTDYLNTNVMGTVRVLEAAREAKVGKLVYAASSSCYGMAQTPTTEGHPISPQYPYALSKFQGEQAAFHWHKVYRLPVNSVRIFNAYGPRVRTTGVYGAVFGVFLKQKLAGKPYTVVGDGHQSRDFIYVTDVAKAFWAAGTTSLAGRVWNIGAGNPQSILRLVELLEGPICHLPKRPGEPDITWADISAIQADLGWQPEVAFDQGVRQMLAQIDAWADAPLWDPASIEAATKTWFERLA